MQNPDNTIKLCEIRSLDPSCEEAACVCHLSIIFGPLVRISEDVKGMTENLESFVGAHFLILVRMDEHGLAPVILLNVIVRSVTTQTQNTAREVRKDNDDKKVEK